MKHQIEFRDEDRASFEQAVNYLGSRLTSLEWTIAFAALGLALILISFGGQSANVSRSGKA